MAIIQWYPGHIAKHERTLKDQLKRVDVVVEVRDARLPEATRNRRLEEAVAHKPRLVLLNKSDLADERETRRWAKALEAEAREAGLTLKVMPYAANRQGAKKNLLAAMVALGEATQQKLMARGLKRRPVRVLIAGMPNVGKSTLINHIVGQKKTKTGHMAGVTRQNQWVRIHPQVELLDTPGIIPPTMMDEDTGCLLAAVNSVGEAAFDDKPVGAFLLGRLWACNAAMLAGHFKLTDTIAEPTLTAVAEQRQYKLPGGAWDELRAARAVLSDFRQGRMGRITLEAPPG